MKIFNFFFIQNIKYVWTSAILEACGEEFLLSASNPEGLGGQSPSADYFTPENRRKKQFKVFLCQ